ncbi:MAG: PhzF family phenazine biosynthesis protein [Alphaproteobacteria bacterium]|nr:PhzF family phenazine biosynthesis protein [Alphaproteobacteria bacterium]
MIPFKARQSVLGATIKGEALRIWLVDAFTNTPFQGNPAGVCLVQSFPSTDFMQNIAAEMNWSQTAFVEQKSDTHFHIRWFSPRDEAPICGHATLASAHVLWEQKIARTNLITFDSLGGPLTACKQKDQQGWITLDFPTRLVAPCPMPELLMTALGDVCVQSVHKDETVYLVVLSSTEEVLSMDPSLHLIEQLSCRAIIVTARSDDSYANGRYDFISRYFAPKVGIPEDPVCGSAHCRLTPFWAAALGKDTLLAHQASRRGGVLRVATQGDRVSISGQAITVGEGTLGLFS